MPMFDAVPPCPPRPPPGRSGQEGESAQDGVERHQEQELRDLSERLRHAGAVQVRDDEVADVELGLAVAAVADRGRTWA
ncbi:hypothetical protein BCD49_27040 [Pseudofrankia sp. EUN1h]|nr:hypothetical protein BCD49_27040 [Pseudofrankia sp. EUN1h]